MQDEFPEVDAEYASPPCFMHELSPEYRVQEVRSEAWSDVLRWRNAQRERLLDARLELAQHDGASRSSRIASRLDLKISSYSGRIVGTYWPFRGEPDLRDWGTQVFERGGRIDLPVVIQEGWPLEYRIWMPGDPIERGVWSILVPVQGPSVQPDIVIAPVVGFDEAHYRLGYGCGFFDRMPAIMQRKPLIIAVSYVQSRIPIIYAQPHDITMDVVLTD